MLSVLGTIVVAAFSRRREFRADAGSAGLAGREKMISALEALKQTLPYADLTGKQAVATLKISGKSGGFMALFATHPPLDERIARLRANSPDRQKKRPRFLGTLFLLVILSAAPFEFRLVLQHRYHYLRAGQGVREGVVVVEECSGGGLRGKVWRGIFRTFRPA